MRHKCSVLAAFTSVINSIFPAETKSLASIPLCPLRSCNFALGQMEIIAVLDKGFSEKLHTREEFQTQLGAKSAENIKGAAMGFLQKFPSHLQH